MINLPEPQLALVREILGRHVPDCDVLAYGSRVSGTAKRHSDLDLAVRGPEAISLRRMANLCEEFQESDILIRVDVHDWWLMEDRFSEIIAQDFVLLQQADPSNISEPAANSR